MKLRHVYQQGFGKEDHPPSTHTGCSFDFREHPDNLRHSDDSSVIVRFDKFGPKQNPRTYEVEIDWSDFKSLLRTFIKAEHEHAEHLIRILKMVRDLDESGWRSAEEPPEFWENLLED